VPAQQSQKGLLNGALFTVRSTGALRRGKVRMLVIPEESDGKIQRVGVIPQFFDGSDGEIPYALRKDSDEFDYGYALTVHKAQGSQWTMWCCSTNPSPSANIARAGFTRA